MKKKPPKPVRLAKLTLLKLKTKLYNLIKSLLLSLMEVLKKWLEVFKYFSTHRRWTLAVFLISSFLSIFILWKIYTIYSPYRPTSQINLTAISDKYEVSYVELYIKYDPNGDDEINTYIAFDNTGNTTQETNKQNSLQTGIISPEGFLITLSPNLRPYDKFNFRNGLEEFNCYGNFSKCYHFTDSSNYSLRESFKGNIFGHTSQGDFLNFELITAKNGAIKRVPVKTVITNLSDVNISTIFPEPKEKYPNGLIFFHVPNENDISFPTIYLTGINQNKSISSQFELIMLGTIFGILASFITSILFEAVKHYETNES